MKQNAFHPKIRFNNNLKKMESIKSTNSTYRILNLTYVFYLILYEKLLSAV